jgi:PAS domain S-box-containing protein
MPLHEPLPLSDEAARLKLLYDLDVFDTEPEASFDSLTNLAAMICGEPMSLVSLVDSHRQYFKSRFGTELTETPRSHSFCSHAIDEASAGIDVFEVVDARSDARFATNPLVVDEPQIRHYAGIALRPTGDIAIGTLCVIGPEAGRLDEMQRSALTKLGGLAEELLRLRLVAKMESEARERARRSEQYYRYLADNTADVVCIHDINLVARYLSPNAPAFVGHTRREVVALESARSLFHPDDVERLVQHFAELTVESPTRWMRARALHKDGSIRHVSIHTRAIFDNGVLQEFQTAARGIDNVIAYERELEEANMRLRALDEQRSALMRGITHDLAAPVAAMRITIESLRSQMTDPALTKQGERLQDFANTAEAFVSDLRNVAAPEHSSYTLDLREIDARKVIELAIAQVPHVSGSELSLELDEVNAIADSHALSRITTNLLTNAHRHTPAGTPITVSLKEHNETAILTVADRGPGIAAEVRTRAFEPYVSSDPNGSGLGLAITKALTEAQDGEVSISSNEPKGTVVSVKLPLAPKPWEEPDSPHAGLG